MCDVEFDLSPMDAKPKRVYRKGSKYDLILEAFLESEHSLMELIVEGLDGNYLRAQLVKRAEYSGLQVDVSVVNGRVLLEK